MRITIEDVLSQQHTEPKWIIKDVLAEGQMVVLAGDAGVGKTLLTCTWALSLAGGIPILGHESEPINVLYINEENSLEDICQYVKWSIRGLGIAHVPTVSTHMRLEHFTLMQSQSGWYEVLRILSYEHQAKLIVIDTATPACQIEDENDNGAANISIGHLRRAQQAGAPGCAMIVLKHATVMAASGERKIRGAKGWKGFTDGTLFHTKAAGRPRNDGLHTSNLHSDKTRAFGLRDRLVIRPKWVSLIDQDPLRSGTGILLDLKREPLQPA